MSLRQRGGPVLRFFLLIAAAAALTLAACGDLSLVGALKGESPGDFRLRPKTANLQVGKEISFTAGGGFSPYSWAIASGSGALVQDPTWSYKAPNQIGLESFIETTLWATDGLGSSDTSLVRIFKSAFSMADTMLTVQYPGSATIQASGGVVPYSWAGDGTVGPAGDTFDYIPPADPTAAETHLVGVTDALGNYKEVTIILLPQSKAPLTIDPVFAGVQKNNTVVFAAFGGNPPYSWSSSEVTDGFSSATGTPVTFTASVSVAGVRTVTVTDNNGTGIPAAAAVVVTPGPILPLELSPAAVTLGGVGDRVQFDATGGVAPYSFSSSPPGYIDGNGRYSQLDGRSSVKVLVQDSAGNSDVAIVSFNP